MLNSRSNSLPMKLMMIVMLLLLVTSCAEFKQLKPKHVKPWDRDILARPEMQFDADALEDEMDDKIYFSKEASRGGASIGGGGCGCN